MIDITKPILAVVLLAPLTARAGRRRPAAHPAQYHLRAHG